jgi:alkanesulfonate monooxygenase SsuD/methylene tetrahydromethanopterin reductase-like flavin-dependent oxidoreductase (luciferase family)
MTAPLRLGVLDFCDVEQRGLGRLCSTLELAMHAERLGYHRYWLAEHYEPGAAHCDALTMTFAVGSVTERIRIGSAGILAGYRQPFHVASTARMLAEVFERRVDLGLSAGAASALVHAELVDRGAVAEPGARIAETFAYLRGAGPVSTIPAAASTGPEPWMLGRAGPAVEHAAELGTHLCISLAHTQEPPDPEVARRYRDAFRPSAECPEPVLALLVAGTCRETQAEADAARDAHRNAFIRIHFAGTPSASAAALEDLAGAWGVRELVILDTSRSFAARHRSLALLADGLRLPAAAAEALRSGSGGDAATSGRRG